jgi:hypothetical protein
VIRERIKEQALCCLTIERFFPFRCFLHGIQSTLALRAVILRTIQSPLTESSPHRSDFSAPLRFPSEHLNNLNAAGSAACPLLSTADKSGTCNMASTEVPLRPREADPEQNTLQLENVMPSATPLIYAPQLTCWTD